MSWKVEELLDPKLKPEKKKQLLDILNQKGNTEVVKNAIATLIESNDVELLHDLQVGVTTYDVTTIKVSDRYYITDIKRKIIKTK